MCNVERRSPGSDMFRRAMQIRGDLCLNSLLTREYGGYVGLPFSVQMHTEAKDFPSSPAPSQQSSSLPKSHVARQPKLGSRSQVHEIRPFSGTRHCSQAALPLGSRHGIMIQKIPSKSSRSWVHKVHEALLFPVGFAIGYVLLK
jgi:hypothetical protein